MTDKTAVILLNLGGPDSLDSIQPFLYNLFSDPDIFKLPLAFITQRLFARRVAKKRAAQARINYEAIGGKSPLLERTQEQAIALTLALNDHGQYDVYVCMRYWHPMSREVISELKDKNYTNIILLPLYPQYSLTTTGSSYNDFVRECNRQRYQPAIRLIDYWYDSTLYQQGIVESIESAREQFSDPEPDTIELLFSAHGLPQKIVDGGDPYQAHIEDTYRMICNRLNWPHTSLCYQSRIGPLQWLKPYTEDIIKEKASQGCQQMLVYPIAFVSDHVETLSELALDYAQVATDAGIAEYRVVPALNDHPKLIAALESLVLDAAT